MFLENCVVNTHRLQKSKKIEYMLIIACTISKQYSLMGRKRGRMKKNYLCKQNQIKSKPNVRDCQ